MRKDLKLLRQSSLFQNPIRRVARQDLPVNRNMLTGGIDPHLPARS